MNTKSLVLPSVLDLKAAAPLAEACLAIRGSDIVVDASKVERLGGQCLQVLVSLSATWQADGCAIDLTEASEAFIDGLAALGLAPRELFGPSHAVEVEAAAA